MLDKIHHDIHKNYHKGDLTLRDYLAAHRTILSNDRSLMGSVRTALTTFVAGISFVKFFENKTLFIIGWVFVGVSIIILAYGIVRYYHIKKMIQSIKKSEDIIKELNE